MMDTGIRFVMNNRVLRYGACIASFVLIMALCHAGFSNRNGYIDNEFNWLYKSSLFSEKWNLKDEHENWYRVYDLAVDELYKVMKSELWEKQPYMGWEMRSPPLSIRGWNRHGCQRDRIIVNMKEGSDEYNFIAVCVNLDAQEIALIYGITYGK